MREQHAAATSRMPDKRIGERDHGRRPSVSNSRPSSSGPRKLPSANGRMYQPTSVRRDAVELGQHQRVGEEDRVVEERLRRHQRRGRPGALRGSVGTERRRHPAAGCGRGCAAANAAPSATGGSRRRRARKRASIPATTASASVSRPWITSQRGLSGIHIRRRTRRAPSAAPMTKASRQPRSGSNRRG